MSPNYIKNYIKREKLEKQKKDVFECLRRKFRLLYKNDGLRAHGYAYNENIRNLSKINNIYLRNSLVKLIVSSPPYLKVIKYGLYNWIRLWLLDENLDKIDSSLDDAHGLENYLKFMKEAMDETYKVMDNDSTCVWIVGDVQQNGKSSINLAEKVWEISAKNSGFTKYDIIEDKIHKNNKTTKIWGDRRGKATMIDRCLVLSKGICDELIDKVEWDIIYSKTEKQLVFARS